MQFYKRRRNVAKHFYSTTEANAIGPNFPIYKRSFRHSII